MRRVGVAFVAMLTLLLLMGELDRMDSRAEQSGSHYSQQ